MTDLTKVRATALPLPTVVRSDERVPTGRPSVRSILEPVLIGESALLLGGSGVVYRPCGRCLDMSGSKPEYMGIYDGVCFECNGSGIRRYAESLDAAQRKIRSAQAAEIRAAAKWEAERPAREAAEAAAAAAALEAAHAAALREQARRDAEAEAFAAQRFVGEAGGKVTVTGVVKVNLPIESRYGWSRLVIVEGVGDDAGVTLKSFGTSTWHYDTEVGETVEVTATVKDHEVYRGVKQTAVIRPKGKVLASA